MPATDSTSTKQAPDAASVSGSSSSNESRRKRSRRSKKSERKNGTAEDKQAPDAASVTGSSSSDESRRRRRRKEKKRKRAMLQSDGMPSSLLNGHPSAFDQRRNSLGKAARDPRDEPHSKKKKKAKAQEQNLAARSSFDSIIDPDGLSRPCKGTRARRDETEEEQEQRMQKMQGAVRTILECCGEDPDREGLLGTPARYAKAMLEFTKGYSTNVEHAITLFHEDHNEMVVVKSIEIYSLCEHHLVPFIGKMHIGYIPNGTVIGLSKLPRIAEMYARRLQIQERLTKEVAHAIMEILKPQGVAVVMESSHLCMVMRGVQKTTSSTITSCVLGCFESRPQTRNEFLTLINDGRP